MSIFGITQRWHITAKWHGWTYITPQRSCAGVKKKGVEKGKHAHEVFGREKVEKGNSSSKKKGRKLQVLWMNNYYIFSSLNIKITKEKISIFFCIIWSLFWEWRQEQALLFCCWKWVKMVIKLMTYK